MQSGSVCQHTAGVKEVVNFKTYCFSHAPGPLTLGRGRSPCSWLVLGWADPGGACTSLLPRRLTSWLSLPLGLPEVSFCLLSVCLDVIPEIPRQGPGPPVTSSKTSGMACRAWVLSGAVAACFLGSGSPCRYISTLTVMSVPRPWDRVGWF